MVKRVVLGLMALLALYVLGGMSARHDIFPWPQLSAVKQQVVGTEPPSSSRYRFDENHRLIADETKTAVPCPIQTDRTAVLLILGQSNAANDGGQRHRSAYGDRVINAFDSRCFIAASPLLGATDTKGEYWTSLGNSLIASGRYDKVVIAPLAYSGSEIARWAKGGDLNGELVDTLKRLKRVGYRPTNVIWVQGEADLVKGTSAPDYEDRFLSMVDTLRGQDVSAPVYIAIASRCLEPSNGGFKVHVPENAIVHAQQALSKSGNGVREGVNTDTLLTEDDRYDDCHIGGSGADKASQAWLSILLDDRRLEASR